jgi:hypothetical protein
MLLIPLPPPDPVRHGLSPQRSPARAGSFIGPSRRWRLPWRPVIEVVLPPQWHQGHSDSRARAIMKREIRGVGSQHRDARQRMILITAKASLHRAGRKCRRAAQWSFTCGSHHLAPLGRRCRRSKVHRGACELVWPGAAQPSRPSRCAGSMERPRAASFEAARSR